MQRGLQLDQAVHHRMLRRVSIGIEGAGEQEHGAIAETRLGLQFVDELLQLEFAPRLLMHRDQAIEHKDAGIAGPNLAANHVEQSAQPVVLQRLEGADIGHPVRDRIFIEELHPPHMPDHAGVALREQRNIQRVAALGRLREANLVAKNGFSGAGRALDDVDAAVENAPTEYRIQTRNAGRDPAIISTHPVTAPEVSPRTVRCGNAPGCNRFHGFLQKYFEY